MSILTRRSLLKMTAGVATSAGFASTAVADASSWRPKVKTAEQLKHEPERLFIENRRTGETFNDYVKQGSIIFDDTYAELNHLMRDWRRDEVIAMDRSLIKLLAAVQSEIGYDEPFSLISGYRSQSTNDMLRRKARNVAKNSYHIRGMAVDLRVKGVSTRKLRKVAQRQKSGGVGYYPSSGFIHLDTGPIRNWIS